MSDDTTPIFVIAISLTVIVGFTIAAVAVMIKVLRDTNRKFPS